MKAVSIQQWKNTGQLKHAMYTEIIKLRKLKIPGLLETLYSSYVLNPLICI